MSITEFLTAVAPWCYLSGSHARGDAKPGRSDIDLYISEHNLRAKLIPFCAARNIPWESPIIGAITIPSYVFGTMIEFANLFPRYRRGRRIRIYGVEFRT